MHKDDLFQRLKRCDSDHRGAVSKGDWLAAMLEVSIKLTSCVVMYFA